MQSLGGNTEPSKKFLGKKIKRLYPDYQLAIVTIFCVEQCGYLGGGREVTIKQFLLNVPMLNMLLRTGLVDGAHWYVAFLIIIYLGIALIKNSRIYKFKYIGIVNNLIIFIVGISLRMIGKAEALSIANYLDYYILFMIGLQLIRCIDSKHTKMHIIEISIVLLYFGMNKNIYDFICIIITILIVYLAYFSKLNFLDNLSVITYIGDNSYLIYLLHQNIGFILINGMLSSGFRNLPAILIITLSSVIVVSSVINKIKNRVFKFWREIWT